MNSIEVHKMFQLTDSVRWQAVVAEVAAAVPERFGKFIAQLVLKPVVLGDSGLSAAPVFQLSTEIYLKTDWCKILGFAFKTDPKSIADELVEAWQARFPQGQELVSNFEQIGGRLLLSLTEKGRSLVLHEGHIVNNSSGFHRVVIAPTGNHFGSLECLRFLAEAWAQYRVALALKFPAWCTDCGGRDISLEVISSLLEGVQGNTDEFSEVLERIQSWLKGGDFVTLWCTQRSFQAEEYRALSALTLEFSRLTLRCADSANRTREAKVLAGQSLVTSGCSGGEDWFSGASLLYALGDAIGDSFDPEVIKLQESANLYWLFISLIKRIDVLVEMYGVSDRQHTRSKSAVQLGSDEGNRSVMALANRLELLLACVGDVVERTVSRGDISEFIQFSTEISHLVLRICNDPTERRLMTLQKQSWVHWQKLIESRQWLGFVLEMVERV